MSSLRAQQILYESEAALRLVDNELHRLRDDDSDDEFDVGMVGYPQLLEDASIQLMAVIEQIREQRSLPAHNASNGDALSEIEAKLVEVAELFANGINTDRSKETSDHIL